MTSGSIVHRRGPNGYDGDRRRFHKIPIGNVDATKGQYLHLGFLNRHASPNENFVSLNMPSMLAVNVIRSTPPWHGSPPRRLSVHGGDHRSFVLRRQPNGSYIRRHPFMPQVSYVYADGLKLGDAYRFGHHLLREQATVGGGTRLRQRWRHVADDIACDAAWLFCHWPLAAGQPTAPLQVTVSEDATDTEPGWSRIASLPASPVTDGSDGAPGLVQCWSEAADGTFAWWSRADFADGGPLRFAAGRTYTVEVSSETTLQQPYRLHPIQLGLSIGRNDDDRAADLNVWREDPADAGRPSYAERWPDGGDGWRTFRLGWDRPDARRRDVALPIWFQRA